ncbi:MAG: filamentous hemagglutinin N-terminal domain-containing protein, partial [Herbaspirillum sp.]|nr:filamentous hemagglutinin N-terminal domain-containing protein [Herbaspirillum sp.]
MTPTSTALQSPPQPQPAVELLPPSITVRVGKLRLTLSWRARKPLPPLLAGLLRRSWRRLLAPVLRISIAAAAVCGAWQAPVLAAAPAAGTLPTGWSVINGNVTFTQNGSTLNINQLSPQAIAGFASFSIGSGAAVNISQPSTAAALLAKVSGGDISQIYGRLSANGTVVLFNPNGVVVGPSGTIDAG